jgi:cyanate permease
MAEWYSGNAYGRTMGMQWAAASLSGAVGPALIGLLHDTTGGYQIPMTLTTTLLAGAALLAVSSGRVRAGSRVS